MNIQKGLTALRLTAAGGIVGSAIAGILFSFCAACQSDVDYQSIGAILGCALTGLYAKRLAA